MGFDQNRIRFYLLSFFLMRGPVGYSTSAGETG
jgi:hypothetical protein